MLVVGLALTTLALVTTLLTRPRAIPEPPHTALPAAPSRAPAAVAARAGSPAPLRYTVQRGDSPWRIAAALTGDGRRWRELWASPAPTLHPGMVLELFAPRDAEGSSR
jgi:nucleoid-associated protein YgaU